MPSPRSLPTNKNIVRALLKTLLVICIALLVLIGALHLYGEYRDRQLRANMSRISVGMSRDEVISILGKPTDESISDIPGTYWSYQPRPLTAIRDPFNEGYLILEMGANGKVVKVFAIE